MRLSAVLLMGLVICVAGCLHMRNSDDSLEMYAGTTDVRHAAQSKSKEDRPFESKFFGCATADTTCSETFFRRGDILDIKLQPVIYNQVFEGPVEDTLSYKGNELGVFVTITEKRPVRNGNVIERYEDVVLMRRKLVMTTTPRLANNPSGNTNTPVYKGVYGGNDLTIDIEVVEFDDLNSKTYKLIVDSVTSAAKAAKVNSLDLVNYFTTYFFEKLSVDDLITKYSLSVMRYGSVDKDPDQFYLAPGEIVLVRRSQTGQKVNWDRVFLNKDRELVVTNEEGEKLPDGMYSYVVLSFLKRLED